MTAVKPMPVAPGGTRLARRRVLREQRRRVRRRLIGRALLGVAALGVVGLATGATLALVGFVGGQGSGPADEEPAGARTGAGGSHAQDTLLLVRTGDDGRSADSVTLFAVDGDGSASVVLIPTGALVDVPGVGLDRLGLAGQYGGPALVQASVENLLGIAVDQVAAVDTAGLGAWLDRLDGLDVTVPDEVVVRGEDGAHTARFAAGPQTLDGPEAAEYASFVGADGDELEVIARQRRVLAALLGALDDSSARRALTGNGDAEPWPLDTDADPGWVERLLAGAADAYATDAARVALLPVERVGGQGPEGRATYRPRDDEVADLRQRLLSASVPDDAADGALRVQILNGVGTPGVGSAVERRLGGGSVRIVGTGNAPSFDEETSRIVVYDDGDRALEAAEEVRARLGVGTIQVSGQPQSVVDVTIIVGADFVSEPAS